MCCLYKLIDKLKENCIQLGVKPGPVTCQASALPLDVQLNLPSGHQSILISQELSFIVMNLYVVLVRFFNGPPGQYE